MCRHESLRTASEEARLLEIVLDMYRDKTLPAAQDFIIQDGVRSAVCTAISCVHGRMLNLVTIGDMCLIVHATA